MLGVCRNWAILREIRAFLSAALALLTNFLIFAYFPVEDMPNRCTITDMPPKFFSSFSMPSKLATSPNFVRFWPFWPFLAVFGLPWALGFLKHLYKRPDAYIYPLAMAPAKKNTLNFVFFSFLFILFVVWLLVVDFSPCWAHFGPLLGAKILQSMTISSLAPNSIL